MAQHASGHWVKPGAIHLYNRYKAGPVLLGHLPLAPVVRSGLTVGERWRVHGAASRPGPVRSPGVEDKGLKKDAIGFGDGLDIALASTAPGLLARRRARLVVVVVGFQAPAVLLVSFVPMFFVAAAFYYMNKADQDCGTSFSWVTRAIGPQLGWIAGWAICVTGILVIGTLADVAAYYTSSTCSGWTRWPNRPPR